MIKETKENLEDMEYSNPSKQPNQLVNALDDLLQTGIRLLKTGDIDSKTLIALLRCASPKVIGYCSCERKSCSLLRIRIRNGIALCDKKLASFLIKAKEEVPTEATTLTRDMISSSCWGIETLGPETTKVIQQIFELDGETSNKRRRLQLYACVSRNKKGGCEETTRAVPS